MFQRPLWNHPNGIGWHEQMPENNRVRSVQGAVERKQSG